MDSSPNSSPPPSPRTAHLRAMIRAAVEASARHEPTPWPGVVSRPAAAGPPRALSIGTASAAELDAILARGGFIAPAVDTEDAVSSNIGGGRGEGVGGPADAPLDVSWEELVLPMGVPVDPLASPPSIGTDGTSNSFPNSPILNLGVNPTSVGAEALLSPTLRRGASSPLPTVGDSDNDARGGLMQQSSTTLASESSIVNISSGDSCGGGGGSPSSKVAFVDVLAGAPRKRKPKKRYACTRQLKRRKGPPKQTPALSIPRNRRLKSAPLPIERPTRGSARLAPVEAGGDDEEGSPHSSPTRSPSFSPSRLPEGMMWSTMGWEPDPSYPGAGDDNGEDSDADGNPGGCHHPPGAQFWCPNCDSDGEHDDDDGEDDVGIDAFLDPSFSFSDQPAAEQLENVELEAIPDSAAFTVEDSISFDEELFHRELKRETSP